MFSRAGPPGHAKILQKSLALKKEIHEMREKERKKENEKLRASESLRFREKEKKKKKKTASGATNTADVLLPHAPFLIDRCWEDKIPYFSHT